VYRRWTSAFQMPQMPATTIAATIQASPMTFS
jgi:hypothetical protein